MRTHIDLFSGIGGFSLAAESCGLQTIAFSEIDPYACKILKKHWPNVPNLGDINNVTGLSAWLLTGGPPCQPASVAGQRKGTADDRWLWPQTIACVERIRPVFCLFENPTGFLTLNGGLEFERVLSQLESLGYSTWAVVVPACAVDAKHRRDRVWILGANTDQQSGTKQEREYQRAKNNGRGGKNGLDAGKIVADAEHGGLSERRRIEDAIKDGDRLGGIQGHEFKSLPEQEGSVLANADDNSGSRLGQHGGSVLSEQESIRSGNSSCRWSEWLPEPAIRRVVDGVPNRSHRLRCLGNAIVPQVAARIIRGLIETT